MALIEFGEIIIKFTQITKGQSLAPLHIQICDGTNKH